MKIFFILTTALSLSSAGIVDLSLMEHIEDGSVTEAIIELPPLMRKTQKLARTMGLSKEAKITAIVQKLGDLTTSAQAPILAAAKKMHLETEAYWISNIILVKGLTAKKLAKLNATAGKYRIRPQHKVKMIPHIVGKTLKEKDPSTPVTAQWGVSKIRAPDAWETTKGENTIACIIDTGVNLEHKALADGYAGEWMDPWYNTSLPTDEHGHGTHCAGSILGRENGIGVAPAAKWIACRAFSKEGDGSEAILTACAQWILTLPAESRPHVVSNSWGGEGGVDWFNPQIEAWRQAGIIGVFAIGNDGPECGTAGSPGDQPKQMGIGSTNSDDSVSFFSSRGPPVNSHFTSIPDFVAPGFDIISSGTEENNYVSLSGTSMATPHVAGAICLLLSAHPKWGYQEVYTAFRATAVKPKVSAEDKMCGPLGFVYGAGRIDVAAALKYKQ